MQALTLRDFASLRYSAGGHALTRQVSQRLGALLAWLALRLRMSPNAVTLLGTGIFILASALFTKLPHGWESTLTCLLLLQLAYALDCADGQLARATGRTSTFGAWLDIACDFLRIVLLGSAVIMWLLFAHMTWLVTMFSGGLFIAGLAIQLHTVTILRHTRPGSRLETAGTAADRARRVLTTVLDTATVLLILALLRDWPPLLAGYAALIGALNLAASLYLASQRLDVS